MITLLSYSKRGSIKYGDFNRFGIVSVYISNMTICVSPRYYQIGKPQEIQPM
jgi:hypothetical protein